MRDAQLDHDEPRVRHEPDPDEQLDAMREQSMSEPYAVRVVYRDGAELYLRADGRTSEFSRNARRFATVDEAQAASDAAQFPYVNIRDIVNLDDPEARVEQ